MSQGDKVRAQFGQLFQGTSPIPIYDVMVLPDGKYNVDMEGCCSPRFIGGVQPGSVGRIDGNPVKCPKSRLKGYEKVAAMGADNVLLFPVFWEHYRQTAWVSQDHFQIIEGNPDLNFVPPSV